MKCYFLQSEKLAPLSSPKGCFEQEVRGPDQVLESGQAVNYTVPACTLCTMQCLFPK